MIVKAKATMTKNSSGMKRRLLRIPNLTRTSVMRNIAIPILIFQINLELI
jgi:hypothetical protein